MSKAVYAFLGVNVEGKKDILGLYLSESEGANFWLVGQLYICYRWCLNGFNQAIEAVYPKAEIQRCIVHQIRSSLRYVSWKDRKAVAKDLKTVYTANTQEDAQSALLEFDELWGKKYPHITQSWTNNWTELSTFFLTESASTRNTQNLSKS